MIHLMKKMKKEDWVNKLKYFLKGLSGSIYRYR